MSLPIVGIGASAGGLESFSELLVRLPADTCNGIRVRATSRSETSRLVEILSKRAGFPVEQAQEGVKILPDRLYVIAPNTTCPADIARKLIKSVVILDFRETSPDCWINNGFPLRAMLGADPNHIPATLV